MAYFQAGTWFGENSPRWAADFKNRDHLIPGPVKLDASQFPITGTVVVTANGAASAAATSITVDPLPGALPSGAVLDFTGSGEFAKLTAPAAESATSISVEALDAGVEDNDTATYVPAGATKKTVPSGTVLGRTQTEIDNDDPWGPAAAADAQTRILAFGIEDLSDNNDGVLYRPHAVVKENLLPEVLAGTLLAGVLANVRTTYTCQRGLA